MNLDHLPYFIAIASTGSLSEASRQLGVSQPTLSCYLKNLESSLGVELFFRNRRKYIPTPAGKLYLKTARDILEVMHHFRSAAQEPEEKTSLRIGLSPIWGVNTLVEIYPELETHFPHMDFHLQEGYAYQLEEYLRKGSLEAIVTSHSNEPPRGLAHLDFTESEMVLAISAFHPMATHSSVSYQELPIADLNDFRDFVFVMPSPTASMYRLTQKLFAAYDFHPRVTTSSPHVRIMETMVKSGTRVALLPSYCVRPGTDLAFFRVKKAPKIILSYITQPDHEFSEVERFLIYLLLKHERDKNYNKILWSDTLRSIVSEFDPVEAAGFSMES